MNKENICCDKLADVLEHGRKKDCESTLHFEGEPPLLWLSAWHLHKVIDGNPQVAWIEEPVRFCPFCGKELQTEEEIRKWLEEHTEK